MKSHPPKPPRGAARSPLTTSRRRGLTLVEMLVAVAVSLILVLSMVRIFQLIGDNVSEGRALVATGSPFEPVTFDGQVHHIGQCNNCFVFPGIGLGLMLSEASRVIDSVFLAAAQALAECAGSLAPPGSLFPSLKELRTVSRQVAFKVAQVARDEGVGRTLDDEAIQAELDELIWQVEYPDLELETEEE